MTCGIYSITNKTTGKMYIGQSVNIEKRWKQHIRAYDANNSYIDRSLKKHGEDAFDFNILFECDKSKLSDEEQKFIKLYGTYKNGYNLTWGGEISPSIFPEIAKKISESNKGEKAYWYGKHFSEETKKKLSAMRKGRKCSQSTKLKMSKHQNTSGIYNVIKSKNKRLKQGFVWRYQYYEDNIQKTIDSVYLERLEKKVKERGLPWIILDEEKVKKSLVELEKLYSKRLESHSSGIKRVHKKKSKTANQGFVWEYSYYNGDKRCFISSVDLDKLKEKVTSQGLEWIIINEDKAKEIGGI